MQLLPLCSPNIQCPILVLSVLSKSWNLAALAGFARESEEDLF